MDGDEGFTTKKGDSRVSVFQVTLLSQGSQTPFTSVKAESGCLGPTGSICAINMFLPPISISIHPYTWMPGLKSLKDNQVWFLFSVLAPHVLVDIFIWFFFFFSGQNCYWLTMRLLLWVNTLSTSGSCVPHQDWDMDFQQQPDCDRTPLNTWTLPVLIPGFLPSNYIFVWGTVEWFLRGVNRNFELSRNDMTLEFLWLPCHHACLVKMQNNRMFNFQVSMRLCRHMHECKSAKLHVSHDFVWTFETFLGCRKRSTTHDTRWQLII